MSCFSLSPSAAAGGDGDSTCDSISRRVERFAVTDRSQTDNDPARRRLSSSLLLGLHDESSVSRSSVPYVLRARRARSGMRAVVHAALGVALLVAQVPALETGEAIPWCVAPDTYVTQPPLCYEGDGDTYSIEFVSNAPRTWCSHRNLLAAMNLPFGDLQFDCYGEKDEKGSCMPLPHEGQQAVCDYSGGHGEDEARCTDVSDGALLAGADSARATSLALTTSTGRIVLANLNTDESASFQAPSYVKTRPCRGPSRCLAEASRRLWQPAA